MIDCLEDKVYATAELWTCYDECLADESSKNKL